MQLRYWLLVLVVALATLARLPWIEDWTQRSLMWNGLVFFSCSAVLIVTAYVGWALLWLPAYLAGKFDFPDVEATFGPQL